MEELSLMERFADPALFDTLTTSEKTAASLITTGMGMGVTFTVLILIWFTIAIMARVLKKADTLKQKESAAAITPVSTPVAIPPITPAAETGADAELIAVIMAAIAAKEGTETINKLMVRKINRISGSQPTWGAAGSADCIESRRF